MILRREKISVSWASHPEQTLQCETGVDTVLHIQISAATGELMGLLGRAAALQKVFAVLHCQAILKLKRGCVIL